MGSINLMYSRATYYFDEMILKKDFNLELTVTEADEN